MRRVLRRNLQRVVASGGVMTVCSRCQSATLPDGAGARWCPGCGPLEAPPAPETEAALRADIDAHMHAERRLLTALRRISERGGPS